MGSPLIWAGNAARFLKRILSFQGSDITIQVGSLDPTSTPVDAEPGSMYISDSTQQCYIKQDSGSSTNWTQQAATQIAGPGITIDGGGSAITTGIKGSVSIPYSGIINSVTLIADQTGDIVIDIKKSTYGGFPTTSSICAAAKPTLSGAQKSEDLTLTGWSTSITAGDILEFTVDSAATLTRCTLVLKVTKV